MEGSNEDLFNNEKNNLNIEDKKKSKIFDHPWLKEPFSKYTKGRKSN
jgi:hypothetical protein